MKAVRAVRAVGAVGGGVEVGRDEGEAGGREGGRVGPEPRQLQEPPPHPIVQYHPHLGYTEIIRGYSLVRVCARAY